MNEFLTEYFKEQKTLSIGTQLVQRGTGTRFLVAQVAYLHIGLINLTDGNGIHEPVPVEHPKAITCAEMELVTWGEMQQFQIVHLVN